jgi:hypothetical protein
VTNPKYKFDPETVGPQLVGFPDESVQEMEEFGKEFMPDVSSWGADTPDPREDPLEEGCRLRIVLGPEFFFFIYF